MKMENSFYSIPRQYPTTKIKIKIQLLENNLTSLLNFILSYAINLLKIFSSSFFSYRNIFYLVTINISCNRVYKLVHLLTYQIQFTENHTFDS